GRTHPPPPPASPHPAAATRASIPPVFWSTADTPDRTEASSSTSITRPVQAADAMPRLLAPVTVQPAACRRSATARPMPADAPVTSTDLAVSLMALRSRQQADVARGPAEEVVRNGTRCPALLPVTQHVSRPGRMDVMTGKRDASSGGDIDEP